MANLETLELTISGSSQEAKQGIDKLTVSLSSLSNAIGKSVRGLVQMNAELQKLKQAGRLRLPSVGSAAGRQSKAADEVARITAWQRAKAPITITNGMGYQTGYQTEAERRAKNPQWYQNPEEQQRQAQQYLRDNGGKASWVGDQEKAAQGLQKIENAAKKAEPAVKNTTHAIRETAKAAQETQPKISGFVKLFEQIGRIFKTLIIRTALRSLIKSFSETWEAAYQYSKSMGGEFAKNVDKARGAIASVSSSIVSTLAPILSGLMPIINTITVGINYLCNALQSLLRLLGIGSDLFGVSAEQIDKYANSSKGGASATKNLLASWDQLNIIQSSGGGGGGGGGGTKSFFSDMVGEEMAAVNMIVAESMMGIGLILACTGHVGLGLGLLAVGAAAFAKGMFEDWNKLPSKVKKTIAEITIVTGVGMLAVGVMALCMGAIPLGLGLMTMGATLVGIQMGIANSEPLGSEVRRTIAEVMEIAAWGLMGVGLIVALFNAPLGLGLVAAGAAAHYAAVSFDKDAVTGIVQDVLDEIQRKFQMTWLSIKAVALTVWTWIDENVWQPIAKAATDTWTAISNWWTEDIITPLSGAWDAVTQFFKDLFGSTEIPGSIASYANDAWCEVCRWWEEDVLGFFSGTWDAIVTFFKGIWGNAEDGTGIAGAAHNAWNAITEWWSDTILANIEPIWNGIVSFFESVFTPIKNVLETIWNFIKSIFGVDGNRADYYLNVHYNTDPVVNLQDVKKPGEILMPGESKKIILNGTFATGGYDIPKGDLFIANEAGAELVGSMNGKTTVANQGQIIEGIQQGVRSANADQNELLREQNRLLRGLLDKEWDVKPSAQWGKFNARSSEMWAMQNGR